MQKRPIDRSGCSVLVLSCDRYRDLWAPFFRLFQQYWPDCDMPVYLGAADGNIGISASVQTLEANDDEPWGKRLRCFLLSIETDYVLLLLEDFFLDQPVFTPHVLHQLNRLRELDGVSIRLYPNPPPDYCRDGIGIIHRHAAFRVSLQAAIWNRKRLLDLLVDDESPWDFEIQGTNRSRSTRSGFYCVPNAVIHYQHVVERGEWFRPAAKLYQSQNIGCDFAARPVMGIVKSWRKTQANRLRRLFTKVHSRWICVRYPESA